jgi:hypothetical protein
MNNTDDISKNLITYWGVSKMRDELKEKIEKSLKSTFHYALEMGIVTDKKIVAPAHCLTVLSYDADKLMQLIDLYTLDLVKKAKPNKMDYIDDKKGKL